jgi:serine/threonine-protein kinase
MTKDVAQYIGNYKILDIIGSGGMANIYTAIHVPLKRVVIIKEMLFAGDRQARERFKQEALLGASLTHKNIVPVYDFFTVGSKNFLVMQYIEGMDLATIMRNSAPLRPVVAALIAREICCALKHAHATGIIHRDIKPTNILISHEGEIKVSDFGVAKGSRSPDLTATGAVIGTPFYMSPEQASGEKLTPQSDIYSVGIVLYEMLTGQKPFSGADGNAITAKVSRGKYKSPFWLDPHHSARLSRIIKKAMKKNLKKRYQTGDHMKRDLERFIGWKQCVQCEAIIKNHIEHMTQSTSATTVIKKKTKKKKKQKKMTFLYVFFVVTIIALLLYLVRFVIQG